MPKTETKTPKLQDVGRFDPAMMSHGAKDRVSVYMDEQAEATMKAIIDAKKNVIITRHAIVSQLLVSWTAEAARRNMPFHTQLFDNLELHHHKQLCQIIDNGGTKWNLY